MGNDDYRNLVIKIVNDNNEKAFEKLFTVFHSKLYKLALMILRSKPFADEVIMDVFTKIWSEREKLRDVKNLESYLYILVRNRAFNFIRDEKKYSFDMINDIQIDITPYKNNPELDFISTEMLDKLNGVVNQLPPKCKAVFKLIREHNLDRHTVSEVLDISTKTIDNQIALAVKKIAESLNITLDNKSKTMKFHSFLLTL